MKKYVSQRIQEYLGPAYASSNFSPRKKFKPVVMKVPGTAYLSKNIRGLHQYPDATLDNCSRTTAVFPQGDLNPNRFCFITSACFFTLSNIMHRQYYHTLLFSAAQIFQSRWSSPCQVSILPPKSLAHTVSYASSAYCS